MNIKELMTKDVITVSVNEGISNIAKILLINRIHAIPVVENNIPIGIITENDFFTKGSSTVYLPEYIESLKKSSAEEKFINTSKQDFKNFLNITAKDIMSSPCITIQEDAEVSAFFSLIREQKLISVPVINVKGELVGIITLADIIDLIGVNA